LFLSAVNIVFYPIVSNWFVYASVNAALVIIIFTIVVKYECKTDAEKLELKNKFSLLKLLRYWYPMIIILYIFKNVYLLVKYIKPEDIDALLIRIDFGMFGVNPTQWIYQFSNPSLTEFLEVIYILYYLVIPVYGIQLYTKKKYEDFKFSVFVLFVGFYLAYTLYLIFPAIGPRFYLHDFYSIQTELPGIFLTEPLRAILDFAESIPAGVPNPQDYVQRDAMPSLHAEVAILLAYLSKKMKLKSFYLYLIYCVLMLIATVYLRYHYVIDLVAGALLAVMTVIIGKLMYEYKDGEFVPRTSSNI
jgi:membrane-associated phospholipid phosphatase